jgi:hypothetical protein
MPSTSTQPTVSATTDPVAKVGRKRKTAPVVSETAAAAEIVPEPVASTEGSTPVVAKPAKKPRKKKEDTSTDVSSVAPSTAVSSTEKKKKRVRKTKKNTRTPSSYVLFSMEYRKTVIEKSPDLTLGEVSKLCGLQWKTLCAADKAPWTAEAEKLKNERKLQIAEQTANDPPKKKRTPSSYLLFAMEHRKTVLEKTPNMSIGDVSKECGAAWKALTDDVKETWKTKATALKTDA